MSFLGGLWNVVSAPARLIYKGASSIYNSFTGRTQAQEANEANAQLAADTNLANFELAKWQNQWSLDQWNRQNEYNSPVNQVARLKEAGLNPNVMAGQISTGNSSSSPSAASAHAQGYNYTPVPSGLPQTIGLFTNLATLAMNLSTAQKQQNLLQSQAEYNSARAYNEMFGRRKALLLGNENLGLRNEYLYKTLPWRVEVAKGLPILQSYQMDAALYRANLLHQAYDFNNSYNPYRLDAIRAGIALRKGQISLQEHQKVIQGIHAKLWSQGINPNDSILMRQLGMALEPLVSSFQELMSQLGAKLAQYLK